MEITAGMVKERRDKTGAGFMDVKKALAENDGDMEKAAEFLRQKGIASAEKKMGRIAAEGIVAALVKDKTGVVLELNCETDFVAKNDEFKNLAQTLLNLIIDQNPQDVDQLNLLKSGSSSVEEIIKELIGTIGEKITIRRFTRYETDGILSTYVHNNKIGVLLDVEGSDEVIAKDICLHIASSAPEYISRDEIPPVVIEEEKRIEMGKEDLANKPEEIRCKIVEGRVNKLMAQKCLLEQPFVKNQDVTIAQLCEGKIKINRFTRFELGEGLEKRSCDFASEVMDQIKGV